MGVLYFDTTDQLKWTTLASALSNASDGAWTIAALLQFEALTDFDAVAYLLTGTGAGTAAAGLSYNSSVQQMFIDVDGGHIFPSDITSTSAPYIFAVSKGSGTVAPRLAWKVGSGGSWTHENASTSMPNSSAADQLQIGTWQDTDNFNGWMGLVGIWEGAMSDGNKEALDDNWQTSDWWDNAHGQPVFLMEMNVAQGSLVDLAGNVSSPSHTGTSLDTGMTLESWDFDGQGPAPTDPAGEAGPRLIVTQANRQVW